MNKTWLVTTMTYRRRVRSGGFLVLTFGIPILMLIVGVLPLLRGRGHELPQAGYVDESGHLAAVTQVQSEDTSLHLIAYPDTGAARTAFERGEIGGYLVIPADYPGRQPVIYYGEETLAPSLRDMLARFLRQALLPDAPAWVLDRLQTPAKLTYVAKSPQTEINEGPAVLVYFGFPTVLALLIALVVFIGATQMGSAVVREKDQRAMEMIITSLAPGELVAGKILGMSLLSLTQLGIWGVAGSIAAAPELLYMARTGALVIHWWACLWALLLGLPVYFLYAVLAAGLGIIAGDSQQAQQFGGLLGFLSLTPIWFVNPLIQAPNGPLAVALTLFPLTGPLISLLRMTLTEIPTWQLVTSLALLIASLAVSIRLVTRIFRAAMLMYGQRLHLRQLLQALRQA